MTRHRVRCWRCGKTARRTGPRLRVGVVGSNETVPTFGLCRGPLHTARDGAVLLRCYEPLMKRADAAKVLRAALDYEMGGWNMRSEYDAE